MRRLLTVGLAAAALFAAQRRANGQDIADLPGQTNPPHSLDRYDPKTPYWQLGRVRPFLAAVMNLGGIYYRPELEVGYGRPHSAWGGAEVWSKISLGGVAFYVGPRLTLPSLDLRVGARMVSSAGQNLLPRREVYDNNHLDAESPPRSHYWSIDSEVNVSGAAPGGNASLLVSAFALGGVEDGYDVFEDSLHIIVQPPLVWRARLTYLASLGPYNNMGLGWAAEVINSPARDLTVFRMGPVVTVALTRHLQATAAGLLGIDSRDDIGLSGADLGQIGLSYRWASGEPFPDFP